MTGNAFYPPTGNEVIDELRGLQVIADQIDDPQAKIEHVTKAVRWTGAAKILGSLMVVDAAALFAIEPDAPVGVMQSFNANLFFIGHLTHFRYLYDNDIPIDSLTLGFEAPEVIGVDPEDAEGFHQLRFEVPILSVETCSIADAA